jgi:hypothetical protein
MSRCAPPLTGRQGKCVLPDKEFRFALLLTRDSSALAWTGFTPAGRSFLPTSACRHAARTISCLHCRPRRVVSEGSALSSDFPADCPHRSPCHCPKASSAGYSEFPAYSQVLLRQRSFHLRTVLDCYYPTTRGGRLISGRLSRSPVRTDYLIAPAARLARSAYSL